MNAVTLSPSDIERVTRSSGWRAQRMEVLDTASGKVVVKGQRPARHPVRYQLLNLLARLVGVPYLKAAPMLGGAAAQQTELARLRALHAAGAPVPRVLHEAPDHFVMQWLGEQHLGDLLQSGDRQAALLWREGGDALVRIHAQGQYLSQGFARNIIVDTRSQPPRLAGMIDFEDDPLQVMGLAEAQVRDWLSYLHSTLWALAPLLPQDQVDAQLDAWMAREPAEVRRLFLHACPKLGWLRRLPRHRRFGRDTVALQAAAAAAHRYAERHDGPMAPTESSRERIRK